MKLVAFAAVVLFAVTANAQDSADKLDAVNAVRVMNTAEMRYFAAHGKYVPADELGASQELKQLQSSKIWPKAMSLVGAEPLPGFTLGITASPDGKAYQLSFLRRGDNKLAFFSDERGIIYQAEPIK
jgi:hypothetical protein